MEISSESLVDSIRAGDAWCILRTDPAWDLTGSDALDLLNRLSTNDLLSGALPRVVETVFTTEKGRIIDRGLVEVRQDGLRLVASRLNINRLRAWIERYTITEDIQWSEQPHDCIVSYILRMNISSLGSKFESELKTEGGRGVPAHPSRFGALEATLSILEPADLGHFAGFLKELGVREITGLYEEFVRILAGIPGPGEFNEGFTPLDVGLRGLVSFAKGCYIGQEVVARLDAYQKVQRELMGITLTGPAPSSSELPGLIRARGADAGLLTSCSPISWHDAFHGLGVVRRDIAVAGSPVEIHCRTGRQSGTLTNPVRLE